jgi:hypothetical protein
VPSDEPSSTTITSGKKRRAADTTSAIAPASFAQGITTAHCAFQFTPSPYSIPSFSSNSFIGLRQSNFSTAQIYKLRFVLRRSNFLRGF